MSSPVATLGFLLDAPLQSWGDSSRFNHRGTAAFPSKSAVIGLIAAARGIDKHEPAEEERLKPFTGLCFSVLRLPRIGVGSRHLPVVPLRDYHTIGAGYDRGHPWQSHMVLRNAEGKQKVVAGNPELSHTEITERDYLADARFLAILEGNAEVLGEIEKALANPVWGVWLGRKSCPPALPVRAELGADRSEVLAKLLGKLQRYEKLRGRGEKAEVLTLRWENFDRVEECREDDAGDQLLHDQPRSFNEGGGAHSPRPVRHLRRSV